MLNRRKNIFANSCAICIFKRCKRHWIIILCCLLVIALYCFIWAFGNRYFQNIVTGSLHNAFKISYVRRIIHYGIRGKRITNMIKYVVAHSLALIICKHIRHIHYIFCGKDSFSFAGNDLVMLSLTFFIFFSKQPEGSKLNNDK